MKPSEQRVQRVDDKLGANDYQPLVVEVDRTIGYEDYAEAQRRSSTFLASRGRRRRLTLSPKRGYSRA
jgi:hypothetical protein